ncbi:hypothetical protein FHL15_000492 [Xylaria flabelliformis]|uniref:Uncharacterized protein n=1 Tax=Xylaria flabelliformis TaxID=2512241 RepID=A0A553IDX7_9PEZI|nr:hypothetical protein FHL15_000492 [Xylaria flabelliformis]
MELTPIRVRGKRRAGGEQPVVARPLLKRLKKGQSQNKQAKDLRPKASEIEKSIPLEILERIFWLSENVNLPRAGPRLGRLLSGLSTLRETFITAFAPTWEVWFGRVDDRGTDFRGVHSYVDWEEDGDQFGGNPSFQTDLLACSWTTIDMILDCRDIWVRRHARTRSFQYPPLWGDPIEPSSNTISSDAAGISDIKDARSSFYRDYNAFRDIERLSTHSESANYRLERNPCTWIGVHRNTEIPDDLLIGPWDEGSLQKFFWLVQAGARLSSGQTWEITREGFGNAISDQLAPNLTVIRLLYILGAFQKWPRYVIEEEYHRIDTIMPTLSGIITLWPKYTYIEMVLSTYNDRLICR